MSSTSIFKELLSAWRQGNKGVRSMIIGAILTIFAAYVIEVWGSNAPEVEKITNEVARFLFIFGATLAIGVAKYLKYRQETKQDLKIEEVEKRVLENPKEAKAAWDLARVKLESYLNRNLDQVRSIFWLTVFVMLVGFSLIGFGILKAFASPTNLYPSIIAAGSGVLVNFIGATFLVLYKSTMAQSAEYMNILERINAVGMSVQIVETLDGADAGKLKQETTAEIAKRLLEIYG